MSYLYILNINPLSMIYNSKIFSPILFIKFSFYFLFCYVEAFQFEVIKFDGIFYFVGCAFGII